MLPNYRRIVNQRSRSIQYNPIYIDCHWLESLEFFANLAVKGVTC